MLILLQEELTACQQLGTSVKERKSGLKVGIKPLDDKEIVLFFKTDHASARKCLQMPESDKKSCDYLALYLKDKNGSSQYFRVALGRDGR